MNISPDMPIAEALALFHTSDADSDHFGFVLEGEDYVAHRDDLEKMAAMGLSSLPIDSIAVCKTSTLLHTERYKLTVGLDYSRRLTEYFPVHFVAALYELQSLIQKMNMKGYVIGGIIRDLFLYKQKKLILQDVDITVEGDALALADFLVQNSRNFYVNEQFPEFGTAKVRYKDTLSFDFASTRQEIYPHCGSLPVVVKRGVPLVDDIIRRDFTINALAFSIHELGKVLDYTNGIIDIDSREIQVLHPVSFYEDPSRILRALKFCARFDFHFSPETRRLMDNFFKYTPPEYKGGGERIKQELKGFLNVAETEAKRKQLAFFIEEGCYHLMNMEMPYQAPPEMAEKLKLVSPKIAETANALAPYISKDFSFEVYLCFLFENMPEEQFQQYIFKLGMVKARREAIEKFRKLQAKDHNRFCSLNEYSSPIEIYDLFSGIPLTTVVASLIDIGLEDESHFRSALEAFVKFKRKWENLSLELNGDDLIELGVPEGREVGSLLNELLHAKLGGHVVDRISEIHYVRDKLAPEVDAQTELPTEKDSKETSKIPGEEVNTQKYVEESGGSSGNVIPFS